jgi:preprotein translocase subunit SecY
MFLPLTLAGFSSSATLTGFVGVFSDIGGFWYNIVFGLMIVAFTYFYTAVIINPNQMAEDMKRNGGYVPGVKPGKKTAEYIDSVMSRITLPGSVFLAVIAILPAMAMKFNVDNQFSRFYGGTSMLILVGVMMDTLQQIESHLLMRHYDGLMKTGRIKGRTSISGATAA